MKTVVVLLSAYNGEEYIKEQIDSILRQNDVNIKCIIRDDGSNDRTREIVENYNDNRIRLITGENVGFIRSFFILLEQAEEGDYYAFADQDDYWEENKLSVAVRALESVKEKNIPIAYFSNLKQSDVDLNFINMRYEKDIDLSPVCSMGHNFAYGCTMVFNDILRDMAIKKMPSPKYNHDAWVMVIANCCGKLIYDKDSYIKYRRHGKNVSSGISTLELIKMQIQWLVSKEKEYIPAADLIENYNCYMSKDVLSQLEKIKAYKKNIVWIIFNKHIHRETIRGTLYLKLKYILGRITFD